jgi:hypothetical protein
MENCGTPTRLALRILSAQDLCGHESGLGWFFWSILGIGWLLINRRILTRQPLKFESGQDWGGEEIRLGCFLGNPWNREAPENHRTLRRQALKI